MLSEELDRAISEVLRSQPIALRAATEGPQNMPAAASAAFESIIAARGALIAAAKAWESAIAPGGSATPE